MLYSHKPIFPGKEDPGWTLSSFRAPTGQKQNLHVIVRLKLHFSFHYYQGVKYWTRREGSLT